LRILQINTVCGVGSTGRITTDLYKVLEEKGHECCIAYGRGTAPKELNTIRAGSDWDVYKHALYTRLFDKTAFASKKATKRLIDKIRQYDPDIIHLHNIHGYFINLKLLFEYLKESKKAVIWSLYDCWSFTGHCCHFDYAGCNKWKTGCYRCEQRKEYPASWLLDHSKENYRTKKSIITGCNTLTIVPPTKWLSDLVGESYLGSYPRVIIPSGIDLDIFRPTENDFRAKYKLENQYIVLGVSNGFGKFKGSKYFTGLAARLPDGYQLVMIGVKEEERKLFPEKVLVLPRTNNAAELAGFYTMADVFVNPTLQETQGLTNIEALACGTGVVTFDSGGSPDCIDDSCGYVVKRGDSDGLLEAVISACQKPFDRNACIQRAGLYDKTKLYQDYIRLYEENMR
jgi:glycosyltransferase involved in cell wall biosynthesis